MSDVRVLLCIHHILLQSDAPRGSGLLVRQVTDDNYFLLIKENSSLLFRTHNMEEGAPFYCGSVIHPGNRHDLMIKVEIRNILREEEDSKRLSEEEEERY